MEFNTLIYEEKENIATLTFNRPRVFNAFNIEMSQELKKAVEHVAGQRAVKVLVLRGSSGNFMAGADINMLQEWSRLSGRRLELRHILLAGFTPTMLERLDKPVIAAVDGLALGMGAEVAWACDLRVATDRAQFGQPEINLGVIPGGGGSQRLPRLAGPAVAADLILTGNRLTAPDAYRLGVVNKVVAPEALEEAVQNYVNALLEKSSHALGLAKRSLVLQRQTDLYTGIEAEMELFMNAVLSEDAKEGTAAFLEKRKPAFQGR